MLGQRPEPRPPAPLAGLLAHPPSAGFPAESVARQYSYWHEAGAFGGGMTCQTAFSTPREPDRFKWPKAGQEGGQQEAPPLWLRMQVGQRCCMVM